MLQYMCRVIYGVLIVSTFGCAGKPSDTATRDIARSIEDPDVAMSGDTNVTADTLPAETTSASPLVTLEITDNPNRNQPGLSPFTKYVRVLDLEVYAEPGVSDANVLHAAHVLAELLDNDEDGEVDDPTLWERLKQAQAMVPIFNDEESSGQQTFFLNYQGEGVSAVLYNTEMLPESTGKFGLDATVEEILHTINAVGHTNIYPTAFALEPDASLLTKAMDIARGGQFIAHPGTYPESAWYHYDDTTCDYRCMAIEYLYWAIVTNMGILNDPATCVAIANEWEPCSPELLKATDTLIYALITDPAFSLPQRAPDGTYGPASAATQ